MLQQVVPVGQVREGIVQRDEGLALLRLHARREIVEHDDAVVGMLQRHGLAHRFDGNGVPVLVRDRDLIRVFAPAARVFQCHGAPFGCDETEDRLVQCLWQCEAREPLQRFVAVDDDPIAVEHDGLVGGLGELAHALLALAHRVLGAPVLGDVGDQHEGAHQPRCLQEVRDEVDLDHACLAVRQRLLAHVFHALALHASFDMRPDRPPGLFADGFAHGQAQDGCGAVAVVGGVTLVGEAATQVGQIEIGHQRRHGVRDEAQQRIAVLPGGRGLGIGRGVWHVNPHWLMGL